MKQILISLVLITVALGAPIATFAGGDRCFCYTAATGCEPIPDGIPNLNADAIQDDATCTNACQGVSGLIKTQYESAVFVPDTYVFEDVYEDELAACAAAHVAAGGQNFNEIFSADAKARQAAEIREPIIPKLAVPFPDLTFSDVILSNGVMEINFINEYVAALYEWMLYAGVIIAIVMVMIGGAQYAVGAGFGEITKARNRIKSAIIGLVLLFGTYTLLYTVNPELTLLEPLQVSYVSPSDWTLEEQADLAYDPSLEKLCSTIDECRDWCLLTNNGTDEDALRDEVPTLATAGMSSPNDLVPIDGISGLTTEGSGHLIMQEGFDMLTEAAAAAKNEGITLYVVSSYRPLLKQLQLACNEIKAADSQSRTPNIPTAVAWPGSSSHGTGAAVDIKYKDSNDKLSWNVDYKSQSSADPENVAKLARIMYGAGWSRYIREIWHFQIYAGSCTSQSCIKAANSCTCN